MTVNPQLFMASFFPKNKPIKALPFPIYYWTVFLLSVSGLLNAAYLSVSHYRVYTDIGYSSFCAISQSINCDTVSQSPYSIFLGIPIPFWGVLGYLFILLVIILAWSKPPEYKHLWTLLFLVTVAYSIFSIILALISSFLIRSYCMMCIVSYGINFLLLFYTWMTRKRFESVGIIDGIKLDVDFLCNKKKRYISFFSPFIIAIILMLIFFPTYWSFESPTLSAYIPHGVNEDGHPWVGAENPQLEIIEFTDYQCFQCNKMHFFLRQFLVKHPGKIRLIHRHFPMDHEVNPIVKKPLHVGSGKLAMLTIYAATQNKFWEMSDFLFSIARLKPVIDIKQLAEETGLNYKELSRAVYDPIIQNKLRNDIMDALKFGVTGTPSFMIDGKVYQGQIPPGIIKEVLD